LPAVADNSRAKRAAASPRKWGNRRPVGKRLDLTPEEAAARDKKRQAKLKQKFVGAFVTEAEKKTIADRAKGYGLKESAFIRTVLLSDLKEPLPPKIDPEAVRALAFELSKVGTNFNQGIAKINAAAKVSTEKSAKELLAMAAQFQAMKDQIAIALARVIEL
jgi:hypothetical protein